MDLNSVGDKAFREKLGDLISPSLPAKELVEGIVKATLESEFGAAFTRSRGFDKMVSVIADSIVANPELRRQSLAVASKFAAKKVDVIKSTEAKGVKDNGNKKG